MMAADERLQRLLGGDALAALRARLRAAYERAPAGTAPTLLRLAALALHEREALAALTGRPPREAASIQLDLSALGGRLRAAGIADDMRAALEQLDGPIAARAAERAADAAFWAGLVARAPHTALRRWLADPAALGLLKRLARRVPAAAEALCAQATAVLGALPAPGWPRARLAATTLGDAHALDDGRPLATLVLALLRQARDAQDDDEDRRAVWAGVGISVNELARPALALNLPRAGGGDARGEPTYWPLRRLLRDPPRWQVDGLPVFVCENPNLVAIVADALGARAVPLVCTEGMPAAAQRTLLAQLVEAGARLRHHGDFDWPGITIANLVQDEFGAAPWRMDAADYEDALRSNTGDPAPLRGARVLPAWSAALGAAMANANRAIAEEAVADNLLQDLV